MTGQDFLEWQREHSELADAGFDQDDYATAVSRLHVLRFHPDKTGKNIVSEIDGTIVFIDNRYYGETVKPDDIWFCSVRFALKVYYALPLRKVTTSTIMGMSDEIRDAITKALWETHRAEFERKFAELYMEEVSKRTREDLEKKYKDEIKDLKDDNEYLKERLDQLDQLDQLDRSIATGSSVDGIELGSDELPEPSADIPPAASAVTEPPARKGPPAQMFRRTRRVPGMPEIARPDSADEPSYELVFERTAEETLRCPDLPDGTYFVHITPSGSFIVIRPNKYGTVICSAHTMRLDGLGRLSGFNGRTELRGEYEPFYGGIVVRLKGSGRGVQKPISS